MATSPNYAWAEPDNSSLVKNGASDIRTLGDAIDTSVWNVGFGQAGKNKIINGDFRINQRSFTSITADGTYGFDRWALGTAGGATYTPQTFTAGTAPVAGYEGVNFAQIATTGQSASNVITLLLQRIEDVRTFAGQAVTVSFWAKAASGTPKIAVELQQNFGSGGSATVNTYAGQITMSSSWARYSVTVTVPSISGKTIGSSSFLSLQLWTSAGSDFNARTGSLGIQTATIGIWGVQVEYGSKATPFQTATGTIQGELAACQRYYYLYVDGNTSTSFGTCAYYSSSDVLGTVTYPVTMRTTPTFSAAAGSFYEVVRNSGSNTLTALQANYLTTRTANIFAGSGQGASGTAGHAGQYRTISVSANAAFSAEL